MTLQTNKFYGNNYIWTCKSNLHRPLMLYEVHEANEAREMRALHWGQGRHSQRL